MSHLREVLLIDAEAGRSETLASRLHLHDAFQVTRADNAASAIELAERERFDAVIVEAELPETEPLHLIRELHAVASGLAVIVLCGARSERLLVQTLEAGAIDCLPRDTAIPVLVARLRAHMRLRDRLDGAPLRIGPLVVWPQRRLLTHVEDRSRIQLTEKELGILRALQHAPRNQISRSRLLDQVWRVNKAVETHTVETHIYRLRQKLKALAGQEVRIVTEPHGYRLTHDDSAVPADAARAMEDARAMAL